MSSFANRAQAKEMALAKIQFTAPGQSLGIANATFQLLSQSERMITLPRASPMAVKPSATSWSSALRRGIRPIE